uniref:Uncharacterized protein n=1 Tax=Aegilops tauschii subsp. strangulata TaxID=200361 RepID=A0A453MTM6_AEGTS
MRVKYLPRTLMASNGSQCWVPVFAVLAGPALLHIRRMLTEFRNTCQRPPLFLKVQVALAVKSVCASITPVPPFSFFV